MPPQLASLLTVSGIIYLFRRDFKEKPNVTGALWLPLLWILIIGSRFVSQWCTMFGLPMGGSLEGGSPIDSLFFFGLIVGGLYVLNQRRASLAEIVRNNRLLTIFFVYCFIAILWSDFPFVAFKRWIKILGHPILALVLFTEPDFEEAVTRLMKRAAYILVPISILFIKYYPQWGRGFSQWTGQGYNGGITADKNALGYDCMVLGFFFFWHFLRVWQWPRGKARREELLLAAGFLAMIGWLLNGADSKTSLVSLTVGVVILLFTGLRRVNKRFIGAYIVGAALVIGTAEMTFGVYENVLKILGRDPSLTDRTDVWRDCLQIPINPILGRGFESFWLGSRLDVLWEIHKWRPNQAHNGYLETYLNLGIVGLLVLVSLLLATYRKARWELLTNPSFGRFRISFLATVIIYNWTEASFKALHLVWFIFYIVAIDYPKLSVASEAKVYESGGGEEEELTYGHPAVASK